MQIGGKQIKSINLTDRRESDWEIKAYLKLISFPSNFWCHINIASLSHSQEAKAGMRE